MTVFQWPLGRHGDLCRKGFEVAAEIGAFLALAVGLEVLVVHDEDIALMRALDDDDVALGEEFARCDEICHACQSSVLPAHMRRRVDFGGAILGLGD